MQDTAVLERGGSVDGEQRTVVSDGGISEGDKAFRESNGIDPGTLAEGPQQNFDLNRAKEAYKQAHLGKGFFRRIWNWFRPNKSKVVEDNLTNALKGGDIDQAKGIFREDMAADLYAHQMESEASREPQPFVNSAQRRPPIPPMR